MGYMGFGMKKEVYARKPKKPFEIIKKSQKILSNTQNSPEYLVSKEYQNFRFKALYQRRWFKLSASILIFFLLILVIWVYVFIPMNLAKDKALFEKVGVLEYYQSQGLDNLSAFLISRRDKVEEIEMDLWRDGVEIWIKSVNYETHPFFGNTYVRPVVSSKMKIHSSDLEIISPEDTTFYSNWRTYLTINNIQELDESVLEYLNTDREEFDDVLRKVSSQKLSLENTDSTTRISFNSYLGYYSIYYSDKLDSTISVIREIKPNVYLIDRY
jgi:hypothetical protein